MSISLEYLSWLERLLGSEFDRFRAIYSSPPSAGLRANTLKIAPGELLQRLGLTTEPLPWCPAGFEIPGSLTLGKHPYHTAGLFYLQDPSAMAAAEILAGAEVLAARPGERVLDLSAAPGGKTTHLAALMHNQGLLVANEIHPRRAWELAENLERWGAHNTAILNETPERLAEHFGAFFDRVLVDAPCSGEGMFRKSEPARRDWSPALVQSCAVRQGNILEQAARLVRPGGWLVYSTCTFNPQENEAVVARFLDSRPADAQWRPVRPPARQGFSPGRPEWLDGPQPEQAPPRPELEQAVRLWPHLSPGEGHFIALLEKETSHVGLPVGEARSPLADQPVYKVDREARQLFSDFNRSHLNYEFDPGRLHQAGSYLYLLPEGLPDVGGLKIIHPGWWLGSLKKERFEPSHALALGLKSTDVRQVSNLELESHDLAAYLHGETVASPGLDGWVLMCVDGFPLGWGRRAQGTIKNYYPRGLRR